MLFMGSRITTLNLLYLYLGDDFVELLTGSVMERTFIYKNCY